MPRDITVTFDDGSTHIYQNAPDDVTPESVSSRAAKDFGKQVVSLDGGKKSPSELTTAEKIASDPLMRFAVGAGEQFQGLIQRLAERGTKSPIPILQMLGAAASSARPTLDEAFAETKKMGEGRGEVGMNIAGAMGNMMSPLSLGAGKLQVPASLFGKAAMGAGLGAAGGTLAPAESDAEAKKNALLGAAIGGVIPPALYGTGKAIEGASNAFVRPVADLFTKQGPHNIVNRYIRGEKVVGEQNLPTLLQKMRGADEMIPGGKPTVAETLVGAPEGSPIAALQDIVAKTGGGNSARFGQRLQDQDAAVKAAEMARDAAAAPARATALESAKVGGVNVTPVVGTVEKLSTTEGYRASDVASKALGEIQSKLLRLSDPKTGIINPADLYTVRKEIGSTIQKFSNENANWDKGMTAKLEREIQLSIDDAIEKAGGTGWKKYLSDYAKASRMIDAYKMRQEMALKPPQPTNLGGGINVAEETRPHIPNLLSRPAMVLNWAMRKAGGGVEPKVDKVLADMMLDPAKFISEMEKMPPKTQLDIYKWLQRSNQLTTGAAAALGNE